MRKIGCKNWVQKVGAKIYSSHPPQAFQLKITKIAWETEGVRSVRNDIKIKEEFNFKQSAKDLLITSQLRTALMFNNEIKSRNYQIDTYKKRIYIYGIAETKDELKLVVDEAINFQTKRSEVL